ncbi:hypothetical protein Tco_0287313 [Tanacetum coccineum]
MKMWNGVLEATTINGNKEVTRLFLELKGDDRGSCKLVGWLLGIGLRLELRIKALQVMDTGCRLFLVTGPLFLQFLGASFTQGTVSSIPIVGSISPEGFLPPILLLVVIIVTTVIVAVILVVVVVAIVGVAIVVAIIGVDVVISGVSFIIKLSFVIIGFEAVTFLSILLGNPLMKDSRSFSVFGTMFGHKTANS